MNPNTDKPSLEAILLDRLKAMDEGDEIELTPEVMAKMKEEFLSGRRAASKGPTSPESTSR
jgi:hypothetical protein